MGSLKQNKEIEEFIETWKLYKENNGTLTFPEFEDYLKKGILKVENGEIIFNDDSKYILFKDSIDEIEARKTKKLINKHSN